jgi:hypothetical protein
LKLSSPELAQDIPIITLSNLEIVTYRLDVASGSLNMKQLDGFDELRNDQGENRKRSAKIYTAVVSR